MKLRKHGLVVLCMVLIGLLLVSCGKPSETNKKTDDKQTVATKSVISFESNGGTEVDSIVQSFGSSVTVPQNPTKEGYTFAGWYIDETFNNLYTFNTMPKNGIILYAKWIFDETQVILVMDNFIQLLIDETGSFVPAWNQEGFKGKWNYIDGVFLKSLLAYYHNYKESNPIKAEEYKEFIVSYVNYYINQNGTFVYYENKDSSGVADNSLGYKSGELDTVCESQILFDLYEMTNDNRYIVAAEYTYNQLMNHGRLNELMDEYINFEHKAVYANQVWLDGMFMYVPFYAQYAKLKNDTTIFSKIKAHYEFIRKNMRNENTGLYYHGYDASIGTKAFWAAGSGNSKSAWLRSTGWLIVSLVDTIEYFPDGDNKVYLSDMLNEAMESLMHYQDSDSKMFYQVIDKGGQNVLVSASQFQTAGNKKYQINGQYVDAYVDNYLESSGSSMIAYVAMKGARLGYLSHDYYKKGVEIFEGIYSHSLKVTANSISLNDICITGGLGDSTGQGRDIRDGSLSYYLAEKVGSNDAKGVGPFVMAYVEYSQYLTNE